MIFKANRASMKASFVFFAVLTFAPSLRGEAADVRPVRVTNGADIYNFYFQKAPASAILDNQGSSLGDASGALSKGPVPVVVAGSEEVPKNIWAEGLSGRFGVGHVSSVGGGMMFGLAYRWHPRWTMEAGVVLSSLQRTAFYGSDSSLVEPYMGVNYTFFGLSKPRVSNFLFSLATGVVNGTRDRDVDSFFGIENGQRTTRVYLGSDVRIKLSRSVGIIYQIRFDGVLGDNSATSNLLYLDLKF